MFKKIIISLSILFLSVIIYLSFKVEKPDKNASIKVGDYSLKFVYNPRETNIYEINYYTNLNDNIIYLHNAIDLLIKKDNTETNLKTWLNKDNNILLKIINNLETKKTSEDNSILYQVKCDKKTCPDFQIMQCHPLDGNKDIHIGTNLNNLENICKRSDVIYTKEEPNKNTTINIKGEDANTIRKIIYKYQANYEIDNSDCSYLNNLSLDNLNYSSFIDNDELYFIYKIDNQSVRFKIPQEEAKTLRKILEI